MSEAEKLTNGIHDTPTSSNKRKVDFAPPHEGEVTPKKKQKTAAASSEENTDVEENENTVPKTPKSAKKGGRGAQARPLPDGFKVEVKKTEKKEWKEYRGPDGKRYTSIADIYRKLGLEEDSGAGAGTGSPAPSGSGGSSDKKADSAEKAEVAGVVTEVIDTWNIETGDGELKKNKNKFYSSPGLTTLPKTDKHFSDVKSKTKSTKSTKDNAKEVAEPEPQVEPATENNHNETISTVSDKKKKKKKKNKDNDKTV